MKKVPLISAVLCTYNRAELLEGALESLLAQSLDKSLYEIVVIDNTSTDHTRDIVKIYQSTYSLPEIALFSESSQGLGYARNTGCKKARGRYVAFIDDDCLATKEWLQILVDCFEHVQPSPLSVGGVVVPVYEEPKPNWFKESYETDTWGEHPRFLKRGESFTGCNMSFRKEIIEKYGGFNVGLGMKGGSLALAEETELFRKIWSAEGEACALHYTPRAVMQHRIDSYKMTVSYQLKRAFSSGQASCVMAHVEPFTRRFLLFAGSIALMLWYSVRALLHIRTGHWQSWAVEELCPVASNIGRLSAYLGIRMVFRQRNAIA